MFNNNLNHETRVYMNHKDTDILRVTVFRNIREVFEMFHAKNDWIDIQCFAIFAVGDKFS